jgi:hypothetical protein
VRIAVAVRQPALVDRLVVARHGAHDLAAVHVQVQVRAERVVVAERVARDQFPGRALKRNTLLVSAPTGHTSMTLPEISVVSGLPS